MIIIVNEFKEFPKGFIAPGFYPIAIDLENKIYWNFDKTYPLVNKQYDDQSIHQINLESHVRSRMTLSLITKGLYSEDFTITELVNELKDKLKNQYESNLNKLLINDGLMETNISIHLWKGIYELAKCNNSYKVSVEDFSTEDFDNEFQILEIHKPAVKTLDNAICICLTKRGFLRGIVQIVGTYTDSIKVKVLGLDKRSKDNKNIDYLYPLYKKN